MLMDYSDSQLFAIGVPKGKRLKDGTEHPFYKLYERAKDGDENSRLLTYTSYDNPLLKPEDIIELENEISAMNKEQVRRS